MTDLHLIALLKNTVGNFTQELRLEIGLKKD